MHQHFFSSDTFAALYHYELQCDLALKGHKIKEFLLNQTSAVHVAQFADQVQGELLTFS